MEYESDEYYSSSSDDDMPYPVPPYNVSYDNERMYIMTTLSKIMNKLKYIEEDIEELMKSN